MKRSVFTFKLFLTKETTRKFEYIHMHICKIEKLISKMWPNNKCTQNKLSETFHETRPIKSHKY